MKKFLKKVFSVETQLKIEKFFVEELWQLCLIVGSTPTRVSIKQYNSYCGSVYGNDKQIIKKS